MITGRHVKIIKIFKVLPLAALLILLTSLVAVSVNVQRLTQAFAAVFSTYLEVKHIYPSERPPINNKT